MCHIDIYKSVASNTGGSEKSDKKNGVQKLQTVSSSDDCENDDSDNEPFLPKAPAVHSNGIIYLLLNYN